MFRFYTPGKRQKTYGFLTLLRSIDMAHCTIKWVDYSQIWPRLNHALVSWLLTWSRLLLAELAQQYFPSRYLLGQNSNENTRTKCEILSKLIKTPERCHRRLSDISVVIFEQVSHIALVFPLSTSNKYISAVKVNAGLV